MNVMEYSHSLGGRRFAARRFCVDKVSTQKQWIETDPSNTVIGKTQPFSAKKIEIFS